MVVLTQIRAHKLRFIKTLCIYVAEIVVGLCSGVVGPTLLDLQLAADTDLDQITYTLPARAGGYAFGSFIIGLIFTITNPIILNTCCLVTAALFFAIAPWTRSLWAMVTVLFANGVAIGMIDSIGNLLVLHIWGKENAPFMQALHFCWGFGNFIAPLLAKPFLLPLNPDLSDNATLALVHASKLNASFDHGLTFYTAEHLQIQWPYTMISIYTTLIAIVFIYMSIKYRDTPPHPSRVAAEEAEKAHPSAERKRAKIIIIVVVALFMHLHCGLLIAYGSLLTTYAVNSPLKLDKATGAELSAVYWFFFTFFRCFTIFYIDFVGPAKNLIFNLCLTCVACVFLVPFSSNVTCLWIGVGLMGLGTSSIWASVYGYLEGFFPVTNRMAALFTVMACLGEFIIPTLMGNYIDTNPAIFLHLTWILVLATCVLFAIYAFLCNKYFTEPNTSVVRLEKDPSGEGGNLTVLLKDPTSA